MKKDDWRSKFDAPPAPPKGSLTPTRDKPNQGRGGAAALLRNRGRSVDEAVDRMSRGKPARSYNKGGSCKIDKPSW